MTLTAHNILTRARTLIAEPASWTQGAMARTKSGEEILPGERAATCFCTAGAIYRAEIDAWREEMGMGSLTAAGSGATHAITLALGARNHGEPVSIVTFNDRPETTHAEILEIFDAAITAEAARS